MTTIYMVGQCLKNCRKEVLDGKKNTSKFTKEFIKNYDEDSNKGYILGVDVKYPKNLHGFREDLPFLAKRMKTGKCKKLSCNLYDKKNYVVHIRSLKQALRLIE